jgi:hypothetical protein
MEWFLVYVFISSGQPPTVLHFPMPESLAAEAGIARDYGTLRVYQQEARLLRAAEALK